MQEHLDLYRDTLLKDIVPFWLKHSLDNNHGGYFTCLTREGKVYDTDKFAWLQGRQVWWFSFLYNQLEQREEWLEAAKLGIDFLKKNGRDSEGNFYFSFTQAGKPLVQAYNIFSDCFASMAFAQYAIASGDAECSEIAQSTYLNILSRQDNPKGIYNKSTGARALMNFSLPMILSNLALELESVLDRQVVEDTLDTCVNLVMEVFWDEEKSLVYENVYPDGSKSDSFEGRLLNPGHGLEAMWFMMEIGRRRNDQTLIQRAAEAVLRILDQGWDRDYGGIFYFLDEKGYPPQQLEWDQKLWWVHVEALVALTKGYELTQDQRLSEWFETVHAYTWKHFPDPKHGEWFGYLNRQGHPHLSLKGGKWKGCFHVPRGLYQVWQAMENME